MSIFSSIMMFLAGLMTSAARFIAGFDAVTFSYCLFILFVGLWFFYRYMVPLYVLSSRLARLVQQGSWGEHEPEEDLRRHSVAGSLLEGIWPAARPVVREFLKSWEERSFILDGQKVSRIDVGDWFSLEKMVGPVWDSPVARSTPFLFTGMGILGTFSGIVMSLSQLRIDPSSLDTAITPLLDGMRTAFSASFLGVLMAVLWTVISGTFRGRIQTRHRWILERVYRAYPVWDPAEALVVLSRQSTGAQSMHELPDRLSRAISDSLGGLSAQLLEPGILRLERSLKMAVDKDVAVQTESLKRIADHFVEALSRQTGGHLTRLGTDLKELESYQRETAGVNRRLVEQLSKLSESLEPMLTSALESAGRLEAIAQGLKARDDVGARQLSGLTRLEERVGELVTGQERDIREIQKRQETLLSELRTQVETFERASQHSTRTLQELVERLRQGSEAIDGASRGLSTRVEAALGATGTSIESTLVRFEKGVVGGLDDAFQQIDGGLSRALEAFSQTLRRAELTVEHLPRVIQELGRTLEAQTPRSRPLPEVERAKEAVS